MDYVVSDQGADFIKNALILCKTLRIHWSSMWLTQALPVQLRVLQDVRGALALDLNAFDEPEDTGRIFGAIAFIYTLQSVAAGEAKLRDAVDLLRDAGLVTNTNIAVAAEALGISMDDVRELVVLQ